MENSYLFLIKALMFYYIFDVRNVTFSMDFLDKIYEFFI